MECRKEDNRPFEAIAGQNASDSTNGGTHFCTFTRIFTVAAFFCYCTNTSANSCTFQYAINTIASK